MVRHRYRRRRTPSLRRVYSNHFSLSLHPICTTICLQPVIYRSAASDRWASLLSNQRSELWRCRRKAWPRCCSFPLNNWKFNIYTYENDSLVLASSMCMIFLSIIYLWFLHKVPRVFSRILVLCSRWICWFPPFHRYIPSKKPVSYFWRPLLL